MNIITTPVTTFIGFIKTLLSILWLSVSSSNFYQKVYKNYQGYGLKYILTISIIVALFYSAIVLSYSKRLVTEIDNITESPNNINYIINQIPDMAYDGQTIAITNRESNLPAKNSLIIKDINDNKIIAIDPSNELLPKDKMSIPVVISNDITIITPMYFLVYDIINAKFFGYGNSSVNFDVIKKNFPHSRLIGNSPENINSESIKNALINLLQPDIISTIFYVFLPLLGGVIVDAILFSPIIIVIILLYFITNIYYPKVTMASCIRLVFFASGIIILIKPITLFIPFISITILQLWTSFLMVSGMLREIKKTPKPPKNIFH
ncbi:MAG: hypothetical protein HRU35_01405 [Rickettsiaceae bacterium]|nr:hypothetical protein [Rickettsiaceae bacterium]